MQKEPQTAQLVEILEPELFSFQVSELSWPKYQNELLLPKSKVASSNGSNCLREILKKHKVE